MSDYVTKKDLDEALGKHQAAILEAVNVGFRKNEERFEKVEASIDRLTTTLDAFLKRLTDHEDEFAILKAEMAQMKAVLKEKFDIEISLQGR